jgi:hypothetical protein
VEPEFAEIGISIEVGDDFLRFPECIRCFLGESGKEVYDGGDGFFLMLLVFFEFKFKSFLVHYKLLHFLFPLYFLNKINIFK